MILVRAIREDRPQNMLKNFFGGMVLHLYVTAHVAAFALLQLYLAIETFGLYGATLHAWGAH